MSPQSVMYPMGPAEIERLSFEIIEREAGPFEVDPRTALVIKRVIHASADLEYAERLSFGADAVAAGVRALRGGATVVCDTTMAVAGINKRVLGSLGGKAVCFIADDEVARDAKRRGTTRSAVSMEHAARLASPLVFAIGNAPTALIRLCELIDEGVLAPELVIGVPVGFVNVVESKELLERTDVARIVARGRKGGSTIAAAIVNALLYIASDDRRE